MSKKANIYFNEVRKVLKEVCQKLSMVNSPILMDSHGLPCPVEALKVSPLIYGYRHTDNFSIRPSKGGISVGTIVGKGSNQEKYFVTPDHNPNIKDSHKLLAHKFTDYLQTKSAYTYCEDFRSGGNWRKFFVRSNDAGDHMCTAIMHPQKLSVEDMNEEKKRIQDYFQPISNELSIRSFYFQACKHSRCTAQQAKFELIFGKPFLEETINGIRVAIFPDSYMENNKGAVEVLYDTLIEEIEPEPDTIVVDLHPHLGDFACYVAPTVCKAIAVYETKESYENALFVLENNKADNCLFVNDNLESYLDQIDLDYHAEDVVLVVKPLTSGVNGSLINSIRCQSCIKKVIFVSSDPMKAGIKNFVHLCLPYRPKDDIKGDKFVPFRATPIEMAPGVERLTMIMTFVR